MRWTAIKTQAWLLILLGVVLGGCTPAGLVKRGQIVGPPRIVDAITGEEKLLPIPSEKPRLIYFWDTDCPRGLSGLRELVKKADQLRKFEIIAVNVDDAERFDRIKKYFLEAGIFVHSFSGNAGDDQLFRAIGGTEVPLYVVVERDGTVRAVGYHLSSVR